MKHYLSAIFSLSALIPFFSAQAQNHPERMVVRDTLGNVHSFLVERIRDVSFSKIEGPVAAPVQVNGTVPSGVVLSTSMTPACSYYRLYITTADSARYFDRSDAATASDIDERRMGMVYHYRLDNYTVSTSANDGEDCIAYTLGYDSLGTPCAVSRARFTARQLSDETAQGLSAISKQYVDNVVNPTYTSLANGAGKLFEQLHAIKVKLQTHPSTLTQAEIDAACETYKDIHGYYQQSNAFLFGAASDYGIDPHIDTWPLDLEGLAVVLTNTAQVKAMDAYDGQEGDSDSFSGDQYAGNKLGPQLLGFHGIEFILFRKGKNRTVADFQGVDNFQGLPDQLKDLEGKYSVKGVDELIFATAVAGDLRNCCWQMEVCWNENAAKEHFEKVESLEKPTTAASSENSYGWNLINAGKPGSTYSSPVRAMDAILVAGCANISIEVGQTKMGTPYTGEDANYIESPYSQRSFIDFYDNIQGIENSYYGSLKGAEDATIVASLHGYLAKKNAALDKKVATAIAEAKAAIQACPAPFVKNYKNAKVQTAIDKCDALTTVLNDASKWIRENN